MHPRRHTSLILQDGSVLPVSRRLNDSVKRFLFKSLKVPMLVLPSVYDAGSVRFESSKATLAQWMPLERSSSSLPITVTPIEDCRAYATEDQPAKLDLVIRNWTTQAIKN